MNRGTVLAVPSFASFCVLHFAFCILHCHNFAQYSAAQQTPAYRLLDGEARTPATFQLEPALLSRSPTTLSIVLCGAGVPPATKKADGTPAPQVDSDDGQRLVTFDANGRVWQRPSPRKGEPTLLADTNCEPACAALSNDARRLAYGDAEGHVAVMDLDQAKIRFRDQAAERTVALAFSPDSRLLAGVTVDGEARLWDVVSGKQISRFAVGASPVQTVAFSPDGERLAVASYGHDVKLYYVDRLRKHSAAPEPEAVRVGSARVTAVAFVPDAKRLVLATSDGTLRLHELSGDREPARLAGHPFAIWSIAFGRDGRRMAAGSWDGTIKLWDTTSWQPLQSLRKHDQSVAAMSFDGERGLVSAGLDGRLLYWLPEVSSISPFAVIGGRDDSVWSTVYSPDGKRLFVGGRGSRFELWDVESHQLLVSRAGHPTTRCAAFSADGAALATGGDDGAIFLCDAHTGQTRATLLRHPGAVSAVLFVDGDDTLISVCDGGVVKVWDTATGQEQASWREHKQQIYCAALSPDEKWLVTGGGNWTTGDPGELLVWERKTGRVHKRLAGHRLAVWSIVFTPDGKRFFSTDSSGAVKVWNFEALAEERTLQHSTWVRPLALSPDGATLAVGRGDGSVRLWDTATWSEKASCDGGKSFAFWLQYSSDGKTLTSGGNDGTVLFWRLNGRMQ